jgi:hypothetical protein
MPTATWFWFRSLFASFVVSCGRTIHLFCTIIPSLPSLLFNFLQYTDATRSTGCYGYTEAESIAVFRALEENTNVKHIDYVLFERHCTQRYALVAAEYLESSKTLQSLYSDYDRYFQELPAAIPLFVQALSRNTFVMEVTSLAGVIRFASVAFQELLTCTQTLKKLQISCVGYVRRIQCGADSRHYIWFC